MRCTLLFLLFAVSFLVLGCGSRPAVDNHVTGNITFDGRPISEGTATFTPKNGKGPLAPTSIKHGLFGLEAPPGGYTVEIQSAEMGAAAGGKQTVDVEVPSEAPKRIKLELKSK